MNWRNWSCSTSTRQLIDPLFSLLLLSCCCLHLMKFIIVAIVLLLMLLLLLLIHVQWLLWPHELLLIHSKVDCTKYSVIKWSKSHVNIITHLKLRVEPLIGPFLFWFIPIAPPPTLKTDRFEPYWAPFRLNWCCSYTDTFGLYFTKLK